MPSRYTFSEYSPEWPAAFEAEAQQLTQLLGDVIIDVHHVGSTSVLGLAAKPVIDLMPIAHDNARIDELTPVMVQAGYKSWGEYGLPGRRFFTKDRDQFRTHNIHIYEPENPEVERHLAFCEYLRHHPEACEEYVAVKRAAYAAHPAEIAAYCDAKDGWIKQAEQLALQWYRQQEHRA